MDQGQLVGEQINAGAKLAGAFDQRFPLQAVFWLKSGENGEWFLYLVSDQINSSNTDVAYDEVIRLFDPASQVWLDPFQVKVAGTDNPIARDVRDIQRQYPSPHAMRLRSRMLGGRYVDDVIIYPIPVPAPG